MYIGLLHVRRIESLYWMHIITAVAFNPLVCFEMFYNWLGSGHFNNSEVHGILPKFVKLTCFTSEYTMVESVARQSEFLGKGEWKISRNKVNVGYSNRTAIADWYWYIPRRLGYDYSQILYITVCCISAHIIRVWDRAALLLTSLFKPWVKDVEQMLFFFVFHQRWWTAFAVSIPVVLMATCCGQKHF